MRSIAFTAPETATLIEVADDNRPLDPDEVRGRTLVTVTSPGTELNCGFVAKEGATYPFFPGYACVFKVEETGADVTGLAPGTVVLSSGGHSEFQRRRAQDVVPLPAGLAPEIAVFARLAGISMSTLATTTARPPSRVLITGLGPVGNLAAQVFTIGGYEVTAIDPDASRCANARKLGLADVRDSIAKGSADLQDKVALHVECSGHEQAVLDGCRIVRKRGEVVLLGVPWNRKTQIYSFDLLHAIFHRYVVLRSGWEWEIPVQPRDFSGNSLMENYRAALDWLADGRLRVDGLAMLLKPERAQEAYRGLLDHTLPAPAVLFDWT